MNRLSRIDAKVVCGALDHRFFIANKPFGFTLKPSKDYPSLETFFREKVPETHELHFPIGVEREVEGLVVITADKFITEKIKSLKSTDINRCLRYIVRLPNDKTTPSALLSSLSSSDKPSLVKDVQLGGYFRQPGPRLRSYHTESAVPDAMLEDDLVGKDWSVLPYPRDDQGGVVGLRPQWVADAINRDALHALRTYRPSPADKRKFVRGASHLALNVDPLYNVVAKSAGTDLHGAAEPNDPSSFACRGKWWFADEKSASPLGIFKSIRVQPLGSLLDTPADPPPQEQTPPSKPKKGRRGSKQPKEDPPPAPAADGPSTSDLLSQLRAVVTGGDATPPQTASPTSPPPRLAMVEVAPGECSGWEVRRLLAEAGCPVLGDPVFDFEGEGGEWMRNAFHPPGFWKGAAASQTGLGGIMFAQEAFLSFPNPLRRTELVRVRMGVPAWWAGALRTYVDSEGWDCGDRYAEWVGSCQEEVEEQEYQYSRALARKLKLETEADEFAEEVHNKLGSGGDAKLILGGDARKLL